MAGRYFSCIALLAMAMAIQAAAQTGRGFKEFEKRLEDYVKLREQQLKKVPALKKEDDPSSVAEHQQALAKAIQSARASATQGNLFTPAAEADFARILHLELTGKGSKPLKKAVTTGNPKAGTTVQEDVTVDVNRVYPSGAPLSSVPPQLLKQLPKLPSFLQYRFVGRTLILLDSGADLIIDYIEQATPRLK